MNWEYDEARSTEYDGDYDFDPRYTAGDAAEEAELDRQDMARW